MIEERFVDVAEGRIFTLQFGKGPMLLFTHATGMCGRMYLDLLQPLASRFRVVAYDARGHGLTELPVDPTVVPTDWRLYRRDLAALAGALSDAPVHLVGHSFGATVSLEAAADYPGLAHSVTLIDPALISFEEAAAWAAMRDGPSPPKIPLAAQAARRRWHFPSLKAARDAWHGRAFFRGWPDSVFDAYLQGGLVADAKGVRLACSPAWEAASFQGVSTTVEESIRLCEVPLCFLIAGTGSMVSVADEERILNLRPDAVIVRFPDAGHFLPVTHAELVRPFLMGLPR